MQCCCKTDRYLMRETAPSCILYLFHLYLYRHGTLQPERLVETDLCIQKE